MTRWPPRPALIPEAAARLPAVGIVGAGLMGRQLTAACISRGLTVTLFDASPVAVRQAISGVGGETGRSTGAIIAAESIRDMRRCDVLIETVFEVESVKRAVLSELESVANSTAVLVTNTSSLSIGRLAGALLRPERFCGLHVCHPLSERRFAEIVPNERTMAATLTSVLAFAKQLGRVPLVVPDRAGFLLNRLLMPYLSAALEMASDGIDLELIEIAARERGMPVGPFTFLDEIGLETALRVGVSLFQAFPDRVRPSGLLVALVKGGNLGRRSGAGFFLWPAGASTCGVNPALGRLIGVNRPASFPPEVIADRLFRPLAVEASWVVRDGTAPGPSAVATSLRLGAGFNGSLPVLGGLDDFARAG